MVTAVLLFMLPSPTVATVPEKTGLVPTAALSGVMGMARVELVPFVIVADELQLTSVPEVVQPKPWLLKLDAAVNVSGMLSVKLTGFCVEAVPMLLMVIRRELV